MFTCHILYQRHILTLASDHDFAQSHLERDLSNLSLYSQGEFRRRKRSLYQPVVIDLFIYRLWYYKSDKEMADETIFIWFRSTRVPVQPNRIALKAFCGQSLRLILLM